MLTLAHEVHAAHWHVGDLVVYALPILAALAAGVIIGLRFRLRGQAKRRSRD
jgi:hypothetical protein